MDEYRVFVKTDSAGCIVSIISSAFLVSFDGWICIDEGFGDRYHHAQNNYFDKPLTDEYGVYRYGLDDNDKPYERTPEEMEADREESQEASQTLESRVADVETKTGDLEEALKLILSGVTE